MCIALDQLIVDDELDWRASEIDVRQLLSQLTPDQREVVELRLSGMTGPEIADILGRSAGAKRSMRPWPMAAW